MINLLNINNIELLIEILIKILLVVLPLLGVVAYYTLAERKVIGYIQQRIGPNRVGFYGIGQPIADAIKLLFKELIVPSVANRAFFFVAPVLALAPSLLAWSVIPFSEGWVIANIDAGLLFLFAMTALGGYGPLLAGWASNSKYAFFGSIRSVAQVISYEIAMGFALVGVLMLADSMNLTQVVLSQQGGIWHWFFLPLFPLFIVYLVSAVAETNRAPFDVAEGESEIVAGFHVEYSGISFALFFLAEYANMILVSALAVIMFMGGWLSPFQGVPFLAAIFNWVPGIVWFFIKLSIFMFLYLWLRATFPRYRYDQIMRLGWKVLIPITLVWLVFIGFLIQMGVV